MDQADELRALHDEYVWKVNAAVEEGRMDLVEQFSDAYTDEALALMTAQLEPGCGRAGCPACERPVRAAVARRPAARRTSFWRRHRWAA